MTALEYMHKQKLKHQDNLNRCIKKNWFLQTCSIGIAEFPNHYWKVTHWMPLPEPPKNDFKAKNLTSYNKKSNKNDFKE